MANVGGGDPWWRSLLPDHLRQRLEERDRVTGCNVTRRYTEEVGGAKD
jgi:hypothetical protein